MVCLAEWPLVYDMMHQSYPCLSLVGQGFHLWAMVGAGNDIAGCMRQYWMVCADHRGECLWVVGRLWDLNWEVLPCEWEEG